MKRVLFVCTGNVFRSATAKLSFEDFLKKNKIKDIKTDSAGTGYKPEQKMAKSTVKMLSNVGIDAKKHKPKQLTKELCDKNDIIVSMGLDHQNYIKENFGKESILFNKLIGKENTPVLDVHEVLGKEWKKDEEKGEKYIFDTTKYIHENIEKVYLAIK